MVQAVIELKEHENRVLNIIKGMYGFKNKSDAINFVIDKFGKKIMELKLRPEYKEELERIDKGKFERFSSIEELRKDIEDV